MREQEGIELRAVKEFDWAEMTHGESVNLTAKAGEGWPRHQEKLRSHLIGADGVVLVKHPVCADQGSFAVFPARTRSGTPPSSPPRLRRHCSTSHPYPGFFASRTTTPDIVKSRGCF